VGFGYSELKATGQKVPLFVAQKLSAWDPKGGGGISHGGLGKRKKNRLRKKNRFQKKSEDTDLAEAGEPCKKQFNRRANRGGKTFE